MWNEAVEEGIQGLMQNIDVLYKVGELMDPLCDLLLGSLPGAGALDWVQL
jgi:hypothetical protein